MGTLKGVGSVVGKAFAYFLTFSTLALIVGLVVANVVHPGSGMNIDPASLDASKVATYAEKAHETSLTGFVMDIIPSTITSAFVEGNILQALFVAIAVSGYPDRRGHARPCSVERSAMSSSAWSTS
ncbi:cation:dicarboxylate symporter family transporter [Paracoccus mutanolyticus]|uniref:cation:dicarboxylate symporter family transporter n=1 Tax=Paracoccus mutanolyticus TaxID=1499308 RepID=UPI002950002A|nr:cation:dicarboxylase symporter family transporter [Paracoccus mutanolyticus]